MASRTWPLVVPAVVVVASGWALLAQAPAQPISNTYILSQSICLAPSPEPPVPLKEGCAPQVLPSGAVLEVQLPGGPSVWKATFVSAGLRQLVAPEVIASPGRIDGTSVIYSFRFYLLPRVAGSSESVTFTENPPFVSKPAGRFTYKVVRR